MTCPHCKNELPEDSKFCQYCGASFVEENLAKNVPPTEEKPKDVKKEKKDGRYKKRSRAVIVILVIVSILLAALNGFQYFYIQRNLEQSLLTEKAEASSLRSRYQTLQDENKTLQTQVDLYTRVFSQIKVDARGGSYGSTSSHFNVDRYVVCIKTNTSTKITMTANWNYGGTVTSISSAPQVATVTFDQESWSYSTTLTIHGGNKVGASKIHFSNSIDNIEFDVLVIVYD